MGRIFLAIALSTVTLFVWSGLSQQFPWGVPSVRSFATTTGEPYVFDAPGLRRAPPGTFTTAAFESDIGPGISTLATDATFSWIVSVPRSSYSPTAYFARELACQAVVAAALVTVLVVLAPLSRRRRLGAVALLAFAGMVGSYGVMTNWWGLPLIYSLGMSVNLLVAWMLAAFVAGWLLDRGQKASAT